MSPLYTDDQKKAVVARFIYERGNKKADIVDYAPIKDCITEKRITLLYALAKSGSQFDSLHNIIRFYTNGDAQTYVEWLISAISGTLEEPVTEDVFKKAVNQLFMFLFNLSGTLQSNVDLFVPCRVNDELEEKLKGYDKSLSSLDLHMNIARERIKQTEARVDRMNEQIIDALEKIGKWQKEYQPYLDDLKTEQEKIGKAFKGNINAKKRDN